MKTRTIAIRLQPDGDKIIHPLTWQYLYEQWIDKGIGPQRMAFRREPDRSWRAYKRLDAWDVYNDAMSPEYDQNNRQWMPSRAQLAYQRLTRNMTPSQACACQDAVIDVLCGKSVNPGVFNWDFANWHEYVCAILAYTI